MSDTVKELEAALAEARRVAGEGKKAEADAIRAATRWIWTAEWLTTFQVKVTREMHPESRAAIEAWKEANRQYSHHLPDFAFNSGGMTYYVVDQHIMSSGGGLVVLKGADVLDRPWYFRDDPRPMTDEEYAELKAGRVPRSLRQPSYQNDLE